MKNKAKLYYSNRHSSVAYVGFWGDTMKNLPKNDVMCMIYINILTQIYDISICFTEINTYLTTNRIDLTGKSKTFTKQFIYLWTSQILQESKITQFSENGKVVLFPRSLSTRYTFRNLSFWTSLLKKD